MPVNILFIENDPLKQNSIKNILNSNLGIRYSIIDDFSLLHKKLENKNFTHLISRYSVNNSTIEDFSEIIEIPILIVDEYYSENNKYNVIKPTIDYSKLISFLYSSIIISYTTIEKYAQGDQDFMKQMLDLIVDEFEINLREIPQLINEENLEEIKSRVHKMVSKFSLLEMNESFYLSKEIDLNIIDKPKEQILNMRQLLVDIEIALNQIK